MISVVSDPRRQTSGKPAGSVSGRVGPGRALGSVRTLLGLGGVSSPRELKVELLSEWDRSALTSKF